VTTLTTEQAIIRDLDRAWTDLICLQIKFEDGGFYSYEDRFNSVGYMQTARRSIARYREELDTHRAQAAEFEARVDRLTVAATTVGEPAAVAVAYLAYGPTVLTLADVVTPPTSAPSKESPVTTTRPLPITPTDLAALLAINPPPKFGFPPVYADLVAAIGELPAARMYHAASQIAYDQRATARTTA
jgi:hypothetical protein